MTERHEFAAGSSPDPVDPAITLDDPAVLAASSEPAGPVDPATTLDDPAVLAASSEPAGPVDPATTSDDPVVLAASPLDGAADGPAVADDAQTNDGDGTGDGDPDDASPAKKRSFWRELPVLVVVALVLAFLIKTFLVQAFYIPSESMENTLLIGDRVLVNKLAYRLGDVERGDVIVFDGANSFDANKPTPASTENPVTRAIRAVASSFGLAPGTESDYIKRVIGVGGDHVTCCNADGNIEVNGVALTPESYLFPGDKPSNMPFDVYVPADHVWVMGDHRSRSEDSRAHGGSPGGGSVPDGDIVGRAFVIVWPLNRLDTLTRPADFAAIPADPVATKSR